MAYHAELNLGLRWSVCTVQCIVLVRHNSRNFVSDKLAISFHIVNYCLSHERSLF